ncbi:MULTISPECIES: hypothetical protein [unclassified Microcoleus]|uniref:hypothetical protein n=1 Tax=unclassified Microcoleus TaxID=2642155 RepID=UPI002FD4ECE2
MIDVIRNCFNSQLQSIVNYLQINYHSESPDSSFANYILHQTNSQISLEVPPNLDAAKLSPQRLNEAPVLATVGYNIACGREFSEDFIKSWADGLIRLSGRDAFPADRTSFFYRPTELLGITLGISHYYKSQVNHFKWLQDILIQGEQKLIHSEDHWTFLLSAYAASILSVTWKARNLPLVKDMSVDELALVKWLCIIEPNFTQAFGLTQSELLLDRTLLEQCIKISHCVQDSARAAILLFSIQTTLAKTLHLIWNECEQIQDNPYKSVEWLKTSCDNFHAVTQHLQSQLSRQSDIGASNIRNMQRLLQAMSKLRSDADIIEEKILEQLSMHSNLYIGNNKGTLITGGHFTMTHNQNESTTNHTTIHASNSSIGFIQSGSGTVSDFSQNIGQNVEEITRLISSLRNMAQTFPEAEREEVLVHLDDLQEDINTPDKRKPQRIKTRLVALFTFATMITGVLAGAADFSNNVLELSEKLGVPIELSHPQSTPQLPRSVP